MLAAIVANDAERGCEALRDRKWNVAVEYRKPPG